MPSGEIDDAREMERGGANALDAHAWNLADAVEVSGVAYSVRSSGLLWSSGIIVPFADICVETCTYP